MGYSLNNEYEGKTDSEKISILGQKVMNAARNTIIIKFRFLDIAVNQLKVTPYMDIYDALGNEKTMSMDGMNIWYNERYVLKKYKEDKNYLNRAVLHMLLHGIFKHFLIGKTVIPEFWDIASDVAVESVIEEFNERCLDLGDSPERAHLIDSIINDTGMLVAEKIYNALKEGKIDRYLMTELSDKFTVDDHSYWHRNYEPPKDENDNPDSDDKSPGRDETDEEEEKENNPNDITAPSEGEDTEEENDDDARAGTGGMGKPDENDHTGEMPEFSDEDLKQIWDQIAEYVQTDLETMSKNAGEKAGTMMSNLAAVNREKYDYTSFLKKFSVFGEKMTINDDEFDYIFYTYGLQRYGNMPLIEPLEYKEVKKVKEFVIAIDTSGSVSGELVQKFITKTYNILKSEESFFTKINLHIIQCDTEIHEDVKITNQDEFDRYIDNMVLKGFGGTDFRPVFRYVEDMIKRHEFTDLKGLIYFTDGWGKFPEHQPDFNTAFVFLDDNYNNPTVPVWAIKLVLSSDEI
ncbi:MAG: VWA-like domain-containing protein [Oscillospiraceae bacterium]|nr:VWA-like domain-containing protein [Oscillospiraceae bacterium]